MPGEVDRNLKVYVPMGIDYCYLLGNSEAKNTREEKVKDVLVHFSKRQQWKYIRRVLREYDTVIFNGYTGLSFLMLFVLNLWYRKSIGIDSDTQYREPSGLFKRCLKRIYLNFVFGNKHVYGLAGGNHTHKNLFRNFGMKEDRIVLMPMMVDNSRFDNAEYKQRSTERLFLREKDCEISVGIQNTNNLRKLEAAVNKAEQAMQQDKLAYYGRNGQERQLKGLNEKLERTLTQKRDTEHFLRVLAPKYRSVYVVNLQDDSVRPIIIPDFFQKILDTSGGSFRAVITAYRDQYVVPESRDAFNSVLDYSFVRSKVLSGEIVEVHYTRTDGAPYTLKITPYSSSGSHIHETIWIFADDTATLTPPRRKLKKQS